MGRWASWEAKIQGPSTSPGATIELYEYPRLDHWNTIHKKPENSFFGKEGKWEDDISGIIVKWIREMGGV